MVNLIYLYIFLTSFACADIKVALVISGNINDFGFNFQLNLGRVNTERALNISSTILVQNIDTRDDAIATFEDLIQRGYNFIISGSFDHKDAAVQMAIKYPNIYFSDKGRKKPAQSNVARLVFNGIDSRFIMGYYAGLMTKTGNVGMVVPGPAVDFDYSINGFWLGARTSCSSCTIYVIKTGTYLNPDLARGATVTMLSHNVDVIGQIQDDNTVTETMIDSGFLGIGNTGYPISTIYGESIGFGVIQDWTPMYLALSESIINGTWIPSRVIEGSFSNGQSLLDHMSFRVSPYVQESVLNVTQQLIDQPFFYLCGPLLDGLKRSNASSNCLTEFDFYQTTQFMNIKDLGNYTIPLTQFALPDGTKTAIIVITALSLFVAITAIGFIISQLNSVVVRSSSPSFTILICIGAISIYCAIFLWVQIPTNTLCSARVWLASFGYMLLTGSLMVKNMRIWLIFENNTFKPKNLKDWKLGIWLSVPLAVDILLLALWQGFANPIAVNIANADGIGTYNYMTVCQDNRSGDNALYTLLIAHFALLFFGCFLSYRLRNIPVEEFNESKSVAAILYSVALCLFIVIPLLIAPQTNNGRIVIICASMLFTTTGSLVILFAPKLSNLYTRRLRRRESYKFSEKSDTTRSPSSDSNRMSDVRDSNVDQPV